MISDWILEVGYSEMVIPTIAFRVFILAMLIGLPASLILWRSVAAFIPGWIIVPIYGLGLPAALGAAALVLPLIIVPLTWGLGL